MSGMHKIIVSCLHIRVFRVNVTCNSIILCSSCYFIFVPLLGSSFGRVVFFFRPFFIFNTENCTDMRNVSRV